MDDSEPLTVLAPDSGAPDDDTISALVSAAQDGDVVAFEDLYHRYVNAVYWIALRKLGNGQEADDATQEVFLRAYTKLSTFNPAYGHFTSWLIRITNNIC